MSNFPKELKLNMNNTVDTDNKTDIVSAACAWIVQIEEGNLTSADQTALKEWIGRSPVHKSEIRRLAQLSGEMNVLTDMMPALDKAMIRSKKLRKSNTKRKTVISFVLVCGVMTFVLFSEMFRGSHPLSGIDTPVFYHTAIGGQKDITLVDGSVLKLNTNTEIEVDFNTERRKIRLVKGEVFFQVAHNADKPFLVYAGDNMVRAVGTAFIVRHLQEKFEVTVTEGKVELKPEAPRSIINTEIPEYGPHSQTREEPVLPVTISAGETIHYTASMQTKVVEKITKREIERELAWQDGLIEFSETPLHEVIAELGRYTTLTIEISDPELRDLKFGGLFRTDQLSVLFDTLEANFGIKLEYQNDTTVRIIRANSQQ